MAQTAITGNTGDRIRSDCQVILQVRTQGGIEVKLVSKVERMFGNQIRQQVSEVMESLGVSDALVEIEDSGALPFVIGARIEAAVKQTGRRDKAWMPPLIEQNQYETGRERFRFSRLYLP